MILIRTMKQLCHIVLLALATRFGVSAAITETSFTTCSLLGGTNDSVRGARLVGGKTVIVCGGTTSAKPEPFWTENAIQSEAPPKSGFFAVFLLD